MTRAGRAAALFLIAIPTLGWLTGCGSDASAGVFAPLTSTPTHDTPTPVVSSTPTAEVSSTPTPTPTATPTPDGG